MVVRKRKKKLKLRGHRTHGKGNTKNKRGKGKNAGKGNAGFLKSKWTYTVKYDPLRFGKHGFHSITKKPEVYTLREIDEMILRGEVQNKEGYFEVDLSDSKIIGTGNISHKIRLKALRISESAKNKILKLGGEVIILK